MGVVRGLFLVLVAAAALAVAYALTWTEEAGLDELPPGQASITPAPGSKVPAARQMAGTSHVEHAPAPPEVVVLAPRGAPASSPTWGSPWSDRQPLAQQLQRELARVGCYDGEINGVWTPATRRALKAFIDRVNAVLPTDAPDRIQLALVEAARERVCGAACPAGETLAEGRCVPNVVLAGRKFMPNSANARADQGPGSATAVPPLAADAPRMGPAAGERGPGLAGPPQTATGIVRSSEAKRRQRQSGFFGFAIFKQFEKLGF
jgi:Putative peptidoglycan binding domain